MCWLQQSAVLDQHNTVRIQFALCLQPEVGRSRKARKKRGNAGKGRRVFCDSNERKRFDDSDDTRWRWDDLDDGFRFLCQFRFLVRHLGFFHFLYKNRIIIISIIKNTCNHLQSKCYYIHSKVCPLGSEKRTYRYTLTSNSGHRSLLTAITTKSGRFGLLYRRKKRPFGC